jgi:pyruvate dehydrogenase E2 component (dihydrolipoamide acetyltransferase)
MQEEGYVAKLFFEAGAKDVPLGTAMAIIVDRKEDIAAFSNYNGSSSGAAKAAPASETPTKEAPAQASPAAAPAKKYPDHIKLEMPNLSPTMEKVSKRTRSKLFAHRA